MSLGRRLREAEDALRALHTCPGCAHLPKGLPEPEASYTLTGGEVRHVQCAYCRRIIHTYVGASGWEDA